DAVGYDESRGDSVNVVNASFTQEAAATPDEGALESVKIWESPLFLDMAKIVGGLVVLLVLVLSVIRPLVRNLIGPAAHQMAVQVLTRNPPPEPSAPQALPSAAAAAVSHEQQVILARTLVNQDPKRVAQLVRGWV